MLAVFGISNFCTSFTKLALGFASMFHASGGACPLFINGSPKMFFNALSQNIANQKQLYRYMVRISIVSFVLHKNS